MTPGEFADAHGLTLDEAEVVLARRLKLSRALEDGEARADRARAALLAAQKKVGVHPVTVDGSNLTQGYDPDADVGKVEFYRKVDGVTFDPPRRADEWEDPP
jgi:arsenate reductase-like glutaredoxin family protein